MDPVTTIAQVIVAGGLAGARPALTFGLLQVYVALFAAEEIPEELRWMVHGYAIAAVAVAAIVEHFARTDPDLDEVLHVPNMVIGAVAAAFTSVLLLGLRGGAAVETPGEGGEETAGAPVLAVAGFLGGEDGASWTMVVVGAVLAALASLAVAAVRRRVLSALDLVAVPARLVRWVETGTVAGALGLALLVPVLAVILAAALVAGSVAAGLLVRAVERRREEAGRIRCECGREVRPEALVCPGCGRDLGVPEVRLGQRPEDGDEGEAR